MCDAPPRAFSAGRVPAYLPLGHRLVSLMVNCGASVDDESEAARQQTIPGLVLSASTCAGQSRAQARMDSPRNLRCVRWLQMWRPSAQCCREPQEVQADLLSRPDPRPQHAVHPHPVGTANARGQLLARYAVTCLRRGRPGVTHAGNRHSCPKCGRGARLA